MLKPRNKRRYATKCCANCKSFRKDESPSFSAWWCVRESNNVDDANWEDLGDLNQYHTICDLYKARPEPVAEKQLPQDETAAVQLRFA